MSSRHQGNLVGQRRHTRLGPQYLVTFGGNGHTSLPDNCPGRLQTALLHAAPLTLL